MTFNIITNIGNGLGLQRDAELLKHLIELAGHGVTLTDWQSRGGYKHHDVNIFIEIIREDHISHARENWFIPNSEWFQPEAERALPRIDRVLCKTQDCLNIWSRKVGGRASYLGFEASDFFKPEVVRQKKFLHIAGNSVSKNTAAVMDAWRRYNIPYPLVTIAYRSAVEGLCRNIPNVTHYGRIPQEQLLTLLNECQFHIMPSEYEGYGHALHEGMGCGAIVITTDAPPMNEFFCDKNLLVPVVRKEPWRQAYRNVVTAEGVLAAVNYAASLTTEQMDQYKQKTRDSFLQERKSFRETLVELVGPMKQPPLIAIVTCKKYADRAQALRDTWVPLARAAGYDVEFFDGERLGVPDDYVHLPLKAKAIFQWAHDHQYEEMLKVDDDTYIQVSRLHHVDADYAGNHCDANDWGRPDLGFPHYRRGTWPHHYITGGAVWFSKKAIQILVDTPLNGDFADDRWVGDTLAKAGIPRTVLPDFYWHPFRMPSGIDFATITALPSINAIREMHALVAPHQPSVQGGLRVAVAITRGEIATISGSGWTLIPNTPVRSGGQSLYMWWCVTKDGEASEAVISPPTAQGGVIEYPANVTPSLVSSGVNLSGSAGSITVAAAGSANFDLVVSAAVNSSQIWGGEYTPSGYMIRVQEPPTGAARLICADNAFSGTGTQYATWMGNGGGQWSAVIACFRTQKTTVVQECPAAPSVTSLPNVPMPALPSAPALLQQTITHTAQVQKAASGALTGHVKPSQGALYRNNRGTDNQRKIK